MKVGFSNGVYNILKYIAQIWLPAAGALYFALSGIWHLPASEQVVGTVTVVDTFLGAILGLSSKAYSPPTDGHVTVDTSDPELIGMNVRLKDSNAVPDKDVIRLKVEHGPLPSPPIPGPHGGN